MKAAQAAALYIKKGWGSPLPTRNGAKYPPPDNTTGNIPPNPRDAVLAAWKGSPEDSNLILRAQVLPGKDYEVIALDIDHYGDKTGSDNLVKIEEKIGSLGLDKMVRSSRRGADNPSGQYFFKVPPGVKWDSKVCSHVEVIPQHYRYSVVWPSIVDGKQYVWLAPDGSEAEIPNVDDLPWLPQAWTKRLKKGSLQLGSRAGAIGEEEARIWLKALPAWRGEPTDATEERVRKAVDGMTEGAHDIIKDEIPYLIKSAAEGFPGLDKALAKLLEGFIAEHIGRDEQRLSAAGAKKEFLKLLAYNVANIKHEVDIGQRVIQPAKTAHNINIELPQQLLRRNS